ncbi:glycoside hydrolase family 9 protein [Kibdelosporangium phytohabitans]|uniref:glycoside hydrolase family 9 protein n=1 Tax=Kibdelosporangium phytohabitans TaxID=860235 RepID=UPI001F16EFAC|nr:glycoside hydrolase family 9 protein [Kibdelosporangium phytohabitans]
MDQVGYATGEAKVGYLLGTQAVSGAPFTVVDSGGRTVHSGKVGASLGSWNSKYKAVHQVDFSKVDKAGTYQVKFAGKITAQSPSFKVDSAGALFQPLVQATTEFFQAQRDGRNVIPGRLDRKQAHLTDAKATVYAEPKFKGDGGDVPAEPLKPVGGPVDVEGGWFDAGDFVKFTSNTAYSLAELGYVQRTGGNAQLLAEFKHGLDWLDKAWDANSRTLYAQVGIGTGSEEFGFLGDHDVWRLPEADDQLTVKPGDEQYFIKYRPVFPAGPAGSPVSPNLAGRVAAAFALGAQVEQDPQRAKRYLEEAASIFAAAKTTSVGELVTAFPHAYYPESSWLDDMELGAAQLALAGRKLGDARSATWAKQATQWAKQYIASTAKDTLNLYDTSALAHAELVGLLRQGIPGAQVTEKQVIDDLKRQLNSGVQRASGSPFRTGVEITSFDAASKSFGFAATARLYRAVTGDKSYDAFGVQQRNFALGSNAWGISLVVGVGATNPKCPHHQAANLAGDPNGGKRVLYGAVINGPNGAENFADLGEMPPGAIPCSNSLTAFDGQGSRFFDDLRSWPSSEPAIDFTSTALLAFGVSR